MMPLHQTLLYFFPMRAVDESRMLAAKRLHGRMATLHTKTRQALTVANQRQKQYTHKHRREVEYKVGGKFVLSTKNNNLYVPDGGTKKLMPKYICPFDVLERLGTIAYRLKFPSNLSIHPVSMCHCCTHTSQMALANLPVPLIFLIKWRGSLKRLIKLLAMNGDL
jgi:hypothetical protein